MKWTKRILLMLPFGIAAILNILIQVSDHLHLRGERVAGYGFLFASPWAWLTDHDWFGNGHSRWVESLINYLAILWIPAALYSACIWLLLKVLLPKSYRQR